MLTVRYEDLIQNTVPVVNRIARFLGLASSARLTIACAKISNDTNKGEHAAAQMPLYRDDHKERIGRWRENLNPREQEAVERTISSALTEYGYE